METDKRPLYIWWIVALASILVSVYFYFLATMDPYFFNNSKFMVTILFIIVLPFIVLVLPIWISMKNLEWRNWRVWGIPLLILLPIPYYIGEIIDCSGSFLCGIGPTSAILAVGVVEIVFLVFYLIGKYFRRWNVKISLFVLCIEALLLLALIGVLIAV